jgi:hypothetical protein
MLSCDWSAVISSTVWAVRSVQNFQSEQSPSQLELNQGWVPWVRNEAVYGLTLHSGNWITHNTHTWYILDIHVMWLTYCHSMLSCDRSAVIPLCLVIGVMLYHGMMWLVFSYWVKNLPLDKVHLTGVSRLCSWTTKWGDFKSHFALWELNYTHYTHMIYHRHLCVMWLACCYNVLSCNWCFISLCDVIGPLFNNFVLWLVRSSMLSCEWLVVIGCCDVICKLLHHSVLWMVRYGMLSLDWHVFIACYLVIGLLL